MQKIKRKKNHDLIQMKESKNEGPTLMTEKFLTKLTFIDKEIWEWPCTGRKKKEAKMTERDWRILREDYEIIVKGFYKYIKYGSFYFIYIYCHESIYF